MAEVNTPSLITSLRTTEGFKLEPRPVVTPAFTVPRSAPVDCSITECCGNTASLSLSLLPSQCAIRLVRRNRDLGDNPGSSSELEVSAESMLVGRGADEVSMELIHSVLTVVTSWQRFLVNGRRSDKPTRSSINHTCTGFQCFYQPHSHWLPVLPRCWSDPTKDMRPADNLTQSITQRVLKNVSFILHFPVSTVTLLVGRQEGHPCGL